MNTEPAVIETNGLKRGYGRVEAVNGLDLQTRAEMATIAKNMQRDSMERASKKREAEVADKVTKPGAK